MAVAHIASVTGTAFSGPSTHTISTVVASGSDRCLYAVAALRENDAVVDSVVFNATETFTQVEEIAGAGGGNNGRRLYVHRRLAPTETTADTVFTLSGGIEHIAAGVSYYTGVDQADPDGTPAEDTATDSGTSTLTPASDATGLVVDFWGGDNATPTPGASQTQRLYDDTPQAGVYSSTKASAASTTSMAEEDNGSASIDWCHIAFQINEVGAVVGRPPLSRLPRQAPFRSSLY